MAIHFMQISSSSETAPSSSLQDKQTTPTYIATILNAGLRSEGHSFKLDNWSKNVEESMGVPSLLDRFNF